MTNIEISLRVMQEVNAFVKDLGLQFPKNLESTFEHDIGFSSLELLELVLALEDVFEVDLPDYVIEQFVNVGDLVEAFYNAKR